MTYQTVQPVFAQCAQNTLCTQAYVLLVLIAHCAKYSQQLKCTVSGWEVQSAVKMY